MNYSVAVSTQNMAEVFETWLHATGLLARNEFVVKTNLEALLGKTFMLQIQKDMEVEVINLG